MRSREACRYWNRRAARRVAFCALSLFIVATAAATSYSAAPELGRSYPSAGPLRVHIVRGSSYYTRNYRVEEVLAHAGANLLTESTQSDRGISQWGGTSSSDAGWLRRCPDPVGYAMDHHLVVVSAVSASGFGKNQQVLVDYVKHGGAVLLFCDSNAFGDRSGKSVFAEMAPLEFPPEGPYKLETEQVSEGVELKAGPDYGADGLPDVEADKPPRVYSYYQVKPKAGAKVLLVAGDNKPIFVTGEFGKGRVAVFTATCRGYPKEGQLAYWSWSGWPTVLGQTLQQITASSQDTPHGLDEKARQAIVVAKDRAYDLLDGVNEAGRERFETVLYGAAMCCHDRSSAEFVLGLIAKYPIDMPPELGDAVCQAVLPWVDENSADHAHALLDSGQPGKTKLGLIVLGATRCADAKPTLEEFYASGEPRKTSGSEVSLATADPESVTAFMQSQEEAAQDRRAALMGLGYLGDQAALPMLRKAVAVHAADGRYQTDAQPDAIESEHRDYQNALVASLQCGEAEAAEPVVDFLLANLSVISRIGAEGSEGAQEADEDERPLAVAWQQQLYRRLAAVPDSVLPALAKRIAAESSSSVVTAAMLVFGGKDLPPEIATTLSESSVAAVAALGKRKTKK